MKTKVLILSDRVCDLSDALLACGADITFIKTEDAARKDASFYNFDAYCTLTPYKVIDARVRLRLEEEAERGKHVFLDAANSFLGIYSESPSNTVRSRLVYVGEDIEGLSVGDVLDDEANKMMQPYFEFDSYRPILVYKNQIIAHTHLNKSKSEILEDSKCGMWFVGDNILMTSFCISNYNKARFAPRAAWEKVIAFIAKWLTGNEPSSLPVPTVTFGSDAELSSDEAFENCRRDSIRRGIDWLSRFLVDEGRGGILEGMKHNVDPYGVQERNYSVRTDCSGEASGAFKMYAHISGEQKYRSVADNLDAFIYGPMQIHGTKFDGMLRWTAEAWQVCYQDDVARAVLATLFDCVYLGRDEYFGSVCRALDFLVKTTGRDGCRVSRTDLPKLTDEKTENLVNADIGYRSAHFNAYYHAALLLAYKYSKGLKREYLDVARRGLETLMSVYPNTVREHSETQEMCRLIFPLALLYEATGNKTHKDMLYRVANDLSVHKHPSGGYREWDTGYTAKRSRESTDECSLLTENGDPIADLLYSLNWLPVGFAYAYYVTGDNMFKTLWREIVGFFINSQIKSGDPLTDGAWCRGFDMDLREAYGCPHDVGWAAYAIESGWTVSEILMGMMLPEIIE